jgi:hypothetical protein
MREILIGWNEISNHLRVDPKTAQRYKKEKALPVQYDPAGHPITSRVKLDKWRFGGDCSTN